MAIDLFWDRQLVTSANLLTATTRHTKPGEKTMKIREFRRCWSEFSAIVARNSAMAWNCQIQDHHQQSVQLEERALQSLFTPVIFPDETELNRLRLPTSLEVYVQECFIAVLKLELKHFNLPPSVTVFQFVLFEASPRSCCQPFLIMLMN